MKNIIRTADVVKRKSLFVVFAAILVFISCNGNKKEKKSEDKLVDSPVNRDTSLNTVTSPTIEREFSDSITANKPLKDESVLLKFNFQKGKTYNYLMSFEVSQKKGDQSRGSTMKWNYDMQVEDEKDGLKTIKTTYKRIAMEVDMPNGQKMEFSSEKEVDAMDFMQLPSKMFGVIKGKSFLMQVNEKGEVVSVTGFDKIGEAVINETNFPEEMKPMLRQNFQKQFNDDAVKQMFSQSFEIFPNKKVKIGDDWKTDANFLKQEVSTVYTVKNIKGNRVFLTGTSKIKSSDGNDSGTQTSKLIIDARTGLMIDGVFDQKSNDGQMTTKSRIVGKEI